MKNPNTKKEELRYLQMVGRVLRVTQSKKNTQTLDFFGINTPPTQAGL